MVRDVSKWRELIREYGRLRSLTGHTPQSRGQRLNELIVEFLHCWGIEAAASVRTTGEVDVVFAHSGVRFILEAKWQQTKADTGNIAKLQKRVRQRIAGTCGIFLSMSGYSAEALADVADGERLEVLLLDVSHWEAMLAGLVPPDELLRLVHDRAAFFGQPHTPLVDLLTPAAGPPTVDFGLPDGVQDDVVRSSVDGVVAEVVLSGIDSDQLGIACQRDGRLLVTTAQAILRVDLKRQSVAVAVPVRDCHRNPLPLDDGSVLFARRHGVGRFKDGEVSTVGGGSVGNSSVLLNPDGSIWLFDNGYMGGISPSITRLGGRVGDESRQNIDYQPASAFSSVWMSRDSLLTIGNSSFAVTSFPDGGTSSHAPTQSNPMGIVHLGCGEVLTAGDGTSVQRTDTNTWVSDQLVDLTLNPSVNELALGHNDDVYIASYQPWVGPGMRFAVVRLTGLRRERVGEGGEPA
ncbi:restriction endonuclease [Lentzea sp. NPDC058436]|uniref:restriction endonuclease n=1 Tax=Lentzea sp. NPDC058436 TaxID=3346499 RepID=UPI003665AC01